MENLNELAEQVLNLAKRVAELSSTAMSKDYQRLAQILALRSVLTEIAAKHGISQRVFEQHLETRRAHFHAKLLQAVESKDAGVAARIDNRRLEDVSTGESFPPLFPPN